jgi:hypothetical protein
MVGQYMQTAHSLGYGSGLDSSFQMVRLSNNVPRD